ncbi:MAG: helix-turn-helix domain-containing protein [Pseudonocardiaceae bacterium]
MPAGTTARSPEFAGISADQASDRREQGGLGDDGRDLAALVNDHLDVEGDEVVWHPRATPKTTIISGEPQDAVLNLTEAADLLRVPENDLQSLAESGEIPGRRIGSEWRFSRQALLHWLGP